MVDASVLLKLKATAKEAKREVNRLGRDMKTDLQQNLRSDIDINDGEIDKAKAKLELLERNIDVNFDTNDPRENFQADLDLNKESVQGIQDSAEDYLPEEGTQERHSWQKHQKKLEKQQQKTRDKMLEGRMDDWADTYDKFGFDNDFDQRFKDQKGHDDIPEKLREWRENFTPENVKRSIKGDDDFDLAERPDFLKREKKRKSSIENVQRPFKRLMNSTDGFKRSLNDLLPGMSTWWRLVGALIPAMSVLAGAGLAVAASLGAIAVAGAGVIGLGLLGHGEGLADSMAKAKGRINRAKRELFDTFQPALQEFAPISDRFLSTLPQRLEPIADALGEITAFEGPFNRLFDDVVGYIADAIKASTQWIGTMEQVGRRMLSLGVGAAGDMFNRMFKFIRDNQDMLIQLAGVFKSLGIVLWRVFVFVSELAVGLKGFFDIAALIANLLQNDWIASFLYWGVVIYGLSSAVGALIGAKLALYKVMATLMAVSLGSMFTALIGKVAFLTGAVYQLVTAFLALSTAAKLAWGAVTLGVGAAVAHVASGLFAGTPSLDSGSGGYGNGNGGMPNGSGAAGSAPTYNANIQVDSSTSRSDRLKIGEEAERTFRRLEDQDDAQEY